MSIRSSSSPQASGARGSRLLAWFDEAKRPLPWRQSRDPYRVWVSEIMLQQTRVETAIPYYEDFLLAFPTVEALARATEEEVFAQWSGLGYYRRARLLLAAARQVVEAGGFPATPEGWLALPGVGPYTAAAVASIAFDVRVVALDGNLERVVSRLEAFAEDPKSASGREFLKEAAATRLDPSRPGDSNQALMEIGATLCRPRKPRCSECPLCTECRAFELDRAAEFPFKRKRKARQKLRLLAAVVKRDDCFLLFRRGRDETVLAGSWELPWIEEGGGDPGRAFGARYGGTWSLGRALGTVRHSITHRDLAVRITEARVNGGHSGGTRIAEGPEARWTTLAELGDLPHSSLVRKALAVSVATGG